MREGENGEVTLNERFLSDLVAIDDFLDASDPSSGDDLNGGGAIIVALADGTEGIQTEELRTNEGTIDRLFLDALIGMAFMMVNSVLAVFQKEKKAGLFSVRCSEEQH